MVHDSSYQSSESDVKQTIISTPKYTTIDFIRQFARTCVTLQGCAFGSMVIN